MSELHVMDLLAVVALLGGGWMLRRDLRDRVFDFATARAVGVLLFGVIGCVIVAVRVLG